jgi:hypothetical protein
MPSNNTRNYVVIAIVSAAVAGSAAFLYRYLDDRMGTGAAKSAPPTLVGAASKEAAPSIDAADEPMAKLYRYLDDRTGTGAGKSAPPASMASMASGGAVSTMGAASKVALPTIDVAAERMAKRLQASGGTGDEWALLARTYVELKRYPDAVGAYARALEKMPGNETLLTEQASARAAAAVPAR